jgi:hypothetical protein
LNIVAFNALGAALWGGVRAGLGDLAGNHISAIDEQIHRYQQYAVIAVGLALVALVVRRLLRRRRTGEEARGWAPSLPSTPRPGRPHGCGRCMRPGS